jgi:hypothetical protein
MEETERMLGKWKSKEISKEGDSKQSLVWHTWSAPQTQGSTVQN